MDYFLTTQAAKKLILASRLVKCLEVQTMFIRIKAAFFEQYTKPAEVPVLQVPSSAALDAHGQEVMALIAAKGQKRVEAVERADK